MASYQVLLMMMMMMMGHMVWTHLHGSEGSCLTVWDQLFMTSPDWTLPLTHCRRPQKG